MKPGRKKFTYKICPKCAINKPRSEFYKKGDTVSHKCKPCSLVDVNSRSSKYFGKYIEHQNNWRKNKYNLSQEYRDKIAFQKKSRYDKRKSEINIKRRHRWANDPTNPARKYFRRKDVKNRTPPWVDLNSILTIYAKCPAGYEVDHVIPLKGLIDGRPVCGLHVEWNLQYLTPTENRKKRNRITEQTLS